MTGDKRQTDFIQKIANLEPGSAPSVGFFEDIILNARKVLQIKPERSKQWFTYLGGFSSPKNGYQKEIIELLIAESNRIISDVDWYKPRIIQQIENIHPHYPRCAVVNPYFWTTLPVDYSGTDPKWFRLMFRVSAGISWDVKFLIHEVKDR